MALGLEDTSMLETVPPEKVKILVGMSGKIDSAVAAFLLKKRGYQVVGVGMSLWDTGMLDPRWADFAKVCSVGDMEAVSKLCEKIGIPFYGVNAPNEYYDRVIMPTIAATLGGETPEPCFDCQNFKMRILYEKMNYLGADFMATGHYAKIHFNHKSGEFEVFSANDETSDQSSLLSGVPQQYLKKLIFPLSELRSKEVEKLAKNFNLPCLPKSKKSTTCYIHHPAYSSFIESKIHKDFRDEGVCRSIDSDKQYGSHNGIHNFYVGQEGFVDSKNKAKGSGLKVAKIDSYTKVVYFAEEEHTKKDCAHLIGIHMPSEIDTTRPGKFYMKCDGLAKKILVNVTFKNNDSALLEFNEPVANLNIGVRATLYNKEGAGAKVVLAGIIFFSGDYFLVNRLEETEKDDKGKIVYKEGPEFSF